MLSESIENTFYDLVNRGIVVSVKNTYAFP